MIKTIKNAYSAAELAALQVTAFPTTKKGIYGRAESEGWQYVTVAGRGGPGGVRREYLFASLPAALQVAIIEKGVIHEERSSFNRSGIFSGNGSEKSDSFSARADVSGLAEGKLRDIGHNDDRSGSARGGADRDGINGIKRDGANTDGKRGKSSRVFPEPHWGCDRPNALSAHQIESRASLYESLAEKAKRRAENKLAAVTAWHDAVNGGARNGVATKAICKKFNIDDATLWRARKDVKGLPSHVWLYFLAGDYAGRTARAEMPAEAWELLKADYLRREQPTAAACIFRLRKMAEARGWELPATRTLQRRLEQLPRVVKELQRKGPTAAKGLYPAQQRLKGALHALEIINGDGYKHNVWVKFPDGEVVRAKTWVWQDVYSSKVVAWRTDKTEHTDVIRLSFGDLVENYGIPEQVTLDNTLAAANKTMSGGVKHRFRFKVKEDEPLGVFALMNVRVSWATPGHGQAKPVERVFGVGGLGEYVDKAPELAGCWTGANPLEKPEYDGRTKCVDLEVLQRVLEREIAAYNARQHRRGAMHNGRSFDDLFNESYASALIRKPTEAQRRLWLLATEPVRAHAKSGEITLDAGRIVGERVANRYWAPDMAEYAGRQVVARFDPARLYQGVHVYTLDGRYICFAECVEAAGFNDANAGREHSRARQTFARAVKAQAVAETRMSILEVAKAYEGTAHPTIPAADVPASKVVRGSFGDPLARPVPQAAPLSEEDRTALAALDREIAEAPSRRVAQIDNPEFNYKRWNALQGRIGNGEQLTEEDKEWHRAYQGSDEWSAMEKLAEDFPDLKQA